MRYAGGMTDAPHRLTWEELCADESLQDLPYRIELNGLNQIVMSPLPYRHGLHQIELGKQLDQLLPHGKASVETSERDTRPLILGVGLL